MLRIQDNVIKMTKGDSGVFSISIYTPDDKIYTIKEDDKVKFYLMRNNCTCDIIDSEDRNKDLVLEKELINGNFKFVPMDTKYLRCGEYYWKVVLTKNNKDENNKDNEDNNIVSTVSSGRFYLQEM